MGTEHLFSIGEFSKATGLTVKTLRFYHDEGLLAPTLVDPQSGYRYYDASKIEPARVVAFLRELEFSVAEVRDILRSAGDEQRILEAMQNQRASLEQRIARYRKAVKSLDQFIRQETQARSDMSDATFNVEEKSLAPMLIAGVRMQGRYSDCGKGFSKIGRSMGRHIAGPCFLLHYDHEYKEDDADFEACFPVRHKKETDGVCVRELPGGTCISLMHKGPYDRLGPSYARILKYAKEKGYRIAVPTREVYLKGPGMIFKGNPEKYLTEIQMIVEGR